MATEAVGRLFGALAKVLNPPEQLSYSEWASTQFRLSGSTSSPGRFRPWKPQRGILDAIGDPTIEFVDVIKSARTGYTTNLMAALGAIAINDPSPIILLMPTDDDARGIAVDEIEPAFRETPALRDLMKIGRLDGRNTRTSRVLAGGGSLKVLSAMAPRNLRRHTAKYLFCDEVDAMVITSEGDPILLGEKRTISYAGRKIVAGSSPKNASTSIIEARYEQSDKRIFEIPCPHCGELFELLWEHIAWSAGQPETAHAICPNNGCIIDEHEKPRMVESGEWRITVPEVQGRAGFRMNALISLFANAAWPRLVKEYETAVKAGSAAMQVFQNTVLGKTWSAAINYVDETMLRARVEPFGLAWQSEDDRWREDIPEDVAYITAGVDVQPDRLETVLLGWSPDHRYILSHLVIRGSALLQSTWDELDALLSTEWKHPLGGRIDISAACIDSGDGNMTQRVYDFCETRWQRKVVAIKGVAGAKPVFKFSTTSRRNRTAPLGLIGVDQVKTDILVSLPLERGERQSFRFSDALSDDFFIQLTAERREVKEKKGRPEVAFVRVGKRRAEGLDCTVYAIAAKSVVRFNFDTRYAELKGEASPRKSLRDAVAKLNGIAN